ncbi:hypothetical protein ISS06_02780 [Patescibacteria group bacterium]|nr:hypothetical protein [Patescibacteria group bacterium]
MKKQIKITPIIKDSYLAMIKNSVGSKMFSCFYVLKGKTKKNAVMNGKLSCAFFVSTILHHFKLINGPHLTVKSTLKDMNVSGWHRIRSPKKGAIISWEERKRPDEKIHGHIGFYIGNKKVISNSFRKKSPICHDLTYAPVGTKKYRKVKDIFWHSMLE